MINHPKAVLLLLKLSLAVVYLYAAISSFIEPLNWTGYFPTFIKNIIPPNILLPLFSTYEIALSLWLLSAKKTFYAGIISALTAFGIIIFNFSQLDVIFRDFTLLFASLALAISDSSRSSVRV